MVLKFLILFTLNCLLNNRTVNLRYNKAPGKTQWYKNFLIFKVFIFLENIMDGLNDVIPRLQAYIKVLEKEKNTSKEELIFQKERLKKIIDLAKHK